MVDWYKEMFEGSLGRYWLSISDKRQEATDKQVSFLMNVLHKGLVLNHCCGPGRISIPLSAHMPVVGLDLSMYLLREAKRRSRQANIKKLHLVRGDVRHLPFKPRIFDDMINFWTSFGFFSEEENETVLKEIAIVLKSKAIFVLDIANPRWLLKNFKEKDWREEDEYLSLEQRSLNWKNKRMRCRWVIVNKQTRKIDDITFDHRLYDLEELKELLNEKGLRVTQVYGSFKKEDFDEARSNRMIILAQNRIGELNLSPIC